MGHAWLHALAAVVAMLTAGGPAPEAAPEAERIFVGPNTGLGGSPGVVVPLVNHDNHLHVRLPG